MPNTITLNWHRVRPRGHALPYLRLELGAIHQVARVCPSNKGGGFIAFYDLPDNTRIDGVDKNQRFPNEREAREYVEAAVRAWLTKAGLA